MSHLTVTLNHIGVAVSKTPEKNSLASLMQFLGIQKGITEAVPEQGVNVHFYNLKGEAPHIELLEVSDPEGTVAKFIAKRGPGIHHLSFQVQSGTLDSLSSRLKQEGFRFIYDAPKKGAQNMRINFVHPASASGVLVELMEPQG